MSDHGDASFRDGLPGDAHAAVRDALPALVHGRVSAAERAELEAHLATCRACAQEFGMLAAVRDAYPTPAISVDVIAAAVRARTVPSSTPAAAQPAAPAPRRAVVPPRRAPAWARHGTLRAFAASALLAIGTGAVVRHRQTVTPATAAHAPNAAPVAVAPTAAPRDPNGSLLGVNFSDLSDAELAAVVAAVDDPAATAPAAEPTPAAPSVLAPDAE